MRRFSLTIQTMSQISFFLICCLRCNFKRRQMWMIRNVTFSILIVTPFTYGLHFCSCCLTIGHKTFRICAVLPFIADTSSSDTVFTFLSLKSRSDNLIDLKWLIVRELFSINLLSKADKNGLKKLEIFDFFSFFSWQMKINLNLKSITERREISSNGNQNSELCQKNKTWFVGCLLFEMLREVIDQIRVEWKHPKKGSMSA